MYFCNNCNNIFEEPKNTYYKEDYYAHGLKIIDFGGLQCPYCESWDYQESVDCIFCGELSKNGVCEKCLESQANLKNALLIKIEENDIDSIITLENAKEYCLTDVLWFEEWLLEKYR